MGQPTPYVLMDALPFAVDTAALGPTDNDRVLEALTGLRRPQSDLLRKVENLDNLLFRHRAKEDYSRYGLLHVHLPEA